MSMNWAENNHNYVPAYQQSGIPFVTSSADNKLTTTPVKIVFPYVTRWIAVGTEGAGTTAVRLGFTENGVNGPTAGTDGGPNQPFTVTGSNANYFLIKADGQTQRFEVKCTEVWLRSDSSTSQFSLMAGYTNVPHDQFLKLTGSNGFWGIG